MVENPRRSSGVDVVLAGAVSVPNMQPPIVREHAKGSICFRAFAALTHSTDRPARAYASTRSFTSASSARIPTILWINVL